MNNNILALIEQYEVAFKEELLEQLLEDSFCLVHYIYGELLNDGFMPSELKDTDKVADILLIDYMYEFSDEETLIDLAQEIALIAKYDDVILEDDEEINEELEPEDTFFIQNIISTANGVISNEFAQGMFHSFDVMAEYISEVADKSALYYTIEDVDCTVGITEMLDAESARELYSQEGHPFEMIANEIPEKATAICVVVHYAGDSNEIQIIELFVIYKI